MRLSRPTSPPSSTSNHYTHNKRIQTYTAPLRSKKYDVVVAQQQPTPAAAHTPADGVSPPRPTAAASHGSLLLSAHPTCNAGSTQPRAAGPQKMTPAAGDIMNPDDQEGSNLSTPAAPASAASTPAAACPTCSPPSTPATPSSLPLVSVHFYFDILSPYSYFAFETLRRYRSEWGLDVVWTPVFNGGLMGRTGNTPPGMVSAKAAYMSKELPLLSQYFEVPLRMPRAAKEVMFGSLPIQRLLVAVKLAYPGAVLEQVIANLWQRHWSNDQDILGKESKIEALLKETGLTREQAEALLEAASSEEVKRTLTQYTDEALAYGAFGVPSLVFPAAADGRMQMLFGSDRFPLMAQMIGRQWMGPVPRRRRLTSRL